MAEGVDHTHGDTGEKPPQSLNFQDGDYPDPEHFDWFWSRVPSAINNHQSLIQSIDSDEDGVVDEADTANLYKNQDIDSDGDGQVDEADHADNVRSTYKGNDLDGDGDGRVDAADHANEADNTQAVKGNDIDSDGDGKVDAADQADNAAKVGNKEITVASTAPSNPANDDLWVVK